MIVLITPTGARVRQFKLCAHYMKRQTYSGDVLWIIVDDAIPVSTDYVAEDFRENWTVVKTYPSPSWETGQNTQGRNLKAGIDTMKNLIRVTGQSVEAIFIIEDDDYYRPKYLDEMMKIQGGIVWGESHTIYYNIRLRRWIENQNDVWSSLFQTAFKPAAIPYFEKLYSEKFIDYVLFRSTPKVKLFRTQNKLSIGIKGQEGRAGIGAGHGYIAHMIADTEGEKLQEFIGDDIKNYLYDWHCDCL